MCVRGDWFAITTGTRTYIFQYSTQMKNCWRARMQTQPQGEGVYNERCACMALNTKSCCTGA